MFTSGAKGFTSKDGKSFTTWDFTVSTKEPQWVLDAAPMVPASDDPASIMLVYKDDGGALRASVFSPPGAILDGRLSPPLALRKPFLQGRRLRAISSWGRAPATTARPAPRPRASVYASTAHGQDGIHEGRWEYNVAEETWAFNNITVANTNLLEAWPWFDTVDTTKGTMRLSHIVSYWTNSGGRRISSTRRTG